MTLLPQQPSSIAIILDTSFKLFTTGFKKIIGFGLLIGVIYLLMAYSINIAMPNGDFVDPQDFNTYALQALPQIFASIIFSVLLSFVFYGAIIYRIDNLVNAREDSFIEALWLGIRKLPAMIFAVFVYSIVVAVGMVLLIIPGILFSLSLMFYSYVIVIENSGGYAAIKSSHALVWGDWWRTMSVFMVPGVVIMIVYFAVGLVVAFTGDLDALNENSLSWVDFVTNFATAFIMPFFYVVGYVQYHDLKLRKSGSDLEARMD